jgi:hypothetical protein
MTISIQYFRKIKMKIKLLIIVSVFFSRFGVCAQTITEFNFEYNTYDEISFEEYEENSTTANEFLKAKSIFFLDKADTSKINIKSFVVISTKYTNYQILKYRIIDNKSDMKYLNISNGHKISLPDAYLYLIKLKGPILMEFYKSVNNPKYPDINKIKSQFKNSEGLLDIDKLGAYLKTRPAALAKYCDF